jgi:hypothetical protein
LSFGSRTYSWLKLIRLDQFYAKSEVILDWQACQGSPVERKLPLGPAPLPII